MKSFSGYLKQEFDNNYVLLAGGGEKLLSDFAMANDYLPLTGGTMTGTINTVPNVVQMNFRPNYNGYNSKMEYMTDGNEAMVWANQSAITSFIFKCGLDLTNTSNWGGITPSLQIKNLSVYINSLIGSGTTPSYNFHVNGTSYLAGRLYENEWIQFSGYTGLFCPNANGAYWYPNNASTYGTWMMQGSRGGYAGIHFGTNTGYMTLMDNQDDKGAYEQDWGWIWYFNRRNKTLGLRTANNTSYAVTCDGDFYCRNGWLRTNGDRGWYNESYGGGWYMNDSYFIKSYNGKILHVNVNSNAFAVAGFNLAADFYNPDHVSITLRTNTCRWMFGGHSNTNLYIGYTPHGSASSTDGGYPVYITPSGGIYTSSDIRLKKDITKISIDSLNELFNISDNLLKSYTWKTTNVPSYGFIAQELEEYIPEAVNEDTSGIKHVNYNVAYAKIIASLIYKIKDLENRIKQLENNG